MELPCGVLTAGGSRQSVQLVFQGSTSKHSFLRNLLELGIDDLSYFSLVPRGKPIAVLCERLQLLSVFLKEGSYQLFTDVIQIFLIMPLNNNKIKYYCCMTWLHSYKILIICLHLCSHCDVCNYNQCSVSVIFI